MFTFGWFMETKNYFITDYQLEILYTLLYQKKQENMPVEQGIFFSG